MSDRSSGQGTTGVGGDGSERVAGRAGGDAPDATGDSVAAAVGRALAGGLSAVGVRSKARSAWELLGDKLGGLGRSATSTAAVSLLSAWLIDQWGLLRRAVPSPPPLRGPDGRPVVGGSTTADAVGTRAVVDLLPVDPLPRFLAVALVLFALYLLTLAAYRGYARRRRASAADEPR